MYGKMAGMGEPRLRVVEWVSGTPVFAICNACRKEFKVPMKALSRTKDAEEYLQQQYDQHRCNCSTPEGD
jgi:hypothetical protein